MDEPSAPTPTRRPLTCNEVAEYLRISLPTLYNMLDRGDIRQLRAGRRRLVPVSALEAYLGEPWRPGGSAAPSGSMA